MLTDTSPEAERVLSDIFRRMSPERKWGRLADLYRTAKIIHASGYRARHSLASNLDVHRDWLNMTLGDDLAQAAWRPNVQPSDELLVVVREVREVFESLGIVYAIGGSLASSFQGKPRFTQDADITVEPFAGREEEFVKQFGGDYYVSLAAVKDAVARRASFNLIHLPTGFKVDVFVRKDRPFDQSALARRQELALLPPPGPTLMVLSAEDIILFKLEWYRLGGETSDRQWSDVVGVLQTQGEKIDHAYLDQWAKEINVADLLAKVRGEIGRQLE